MEFKEEDPKLIMKKGELVSLTNNEILKREILNGKSKGFKFCLI